jgi:hypothetical protein
VARNHIWVLAKNLPTTLWKKYRAGIVAAQLSRFTDAARSWRGAAARATMRGQLAGLVGLPKMLRKRRSIQIHRRVSDAYIESLFVRV